MSWRVSHAGLRLRKQPAGSPSDMIADVHSSVGHAGLRLRKQPSDRFLYVDSSSGERQLARGGVG
jgi:hypothetical protein